MHHSKGFLNMAMDAKTRIQEMDIQQVKQMLDAGEDFQLIDVREESEWARGHLPHAMHLGKGIIERDIEKAVPDCNKKCVLYCGGGFRSALVADNLQKMGYNNVWSMDGGVRAWREAGYPMD